MTETLMFDNETLDVDEFLCDVALHLRRRDVRVLLSYLGMPTREIDELLTEHSRLHFGVERGMLTSRGQVVDGSSGINFLKQRVKAMRAWWFYAANTRQRTTPAKQNIKIVESRAAILTGIHEAKEEKDGFIVSQLHRNEENNVTSFLGDTMNPAVKASDLQIKLNDSNETEVVIVTGEDDMIVNSVVCDQDSATKEINSLFPPVQSEIPGTPPRLTESQKSKRMSSNLPHVSSGSIVEIPTVEMNDNSSQTQFGGSITSKSDGKQLRWAENEKTEVGEKENVILANENEITLEELLRKLWRCLQASGLSRVVDELQQRWMIRIDTSQRKADMFPKMTWGTPPAPQTPFTYPPYKKIGHMSVMGAPMVIESRPLDQGLRTERLEVNSLLSSSLDINSAQAVEKTKLPPSAAGSLGSNRERASRAPWSERSLTSLDGMTTAPFPTRDAWKMRTDTIMRRGGSLSVHVLVDHVTLPSQLVASWGSSLHVTPHQMREKAARMFLNYVTRDAKDVCKAVDRIERIRGLAVENILKRIVSGFLTASNTMDSVGSELVMQCRCLYPETVEQLWLWYQSGQLRESMQAGLVTKRIRQACTVEQLRLRVYIAEEEYRRALGLLRRKPMPNTKTGRYYVTTGTGGVVGGASGLSHPQRQALTSVTRYIKLPGPSPIDLSNRYIASLAIPSPRKALQEAENVMRNKTIMYGGKRMKSSRALVDKILNKEVLALRQRIRMCEDEWCEFAARDLVVMLQCARNVMQRRITGAITAEQLTPKCSSLNLLQALHRALISRGGTSNTVATPRGYSCATSVSNSHSNIALYPTEITFSHTDLVTTINDDDFVIKARRQEERDFASAFAHFSDLLVELSSCRKHVQEKIIARLTTNPTIAHSKQLYLTKDVYTLIERWRSMVSKDFNYANDPTVRVLAHQILNDAPLSSVFTHNVQQQFPGFIGLLPATFQVADEVLEKLQDLLTSAYGASVGSSLVYPSVQGSDGQRQTLSVRLVV